MSTFGNTADIYAIVHLVPHACQHITVDQSHNTGDTVAKILDINPLKPELNPICYLLALLGAHHFLHVSRIRFKLLTFRLLMSYIYIWSNHS